jgi:hypothetical protein
LYLIREMGDTSLKEIAQLFSLESYGSVGGACTVIERQIKRDRKLRSRIEQIREMAISTSTQTKTPLPLLVRARAMKKATGVARRRNGLRDANSRPHVRKLAGKKSKPRIAPGLKSEIKT